MPCIKCGGNTFNVSVKPMMQTCTNCGNKEIWEPGKESIGLQPREGYCIVCDKKISHQKGQNGSHLIHGLPAHRKCMIAYTAWEVNRDKPGLSESEFRIEQQIRNVENVICR